MVAIEATNPGGRSHEEPNTSEDNDDQENPAQTSDAFEDFTNSSPLDEVSEKKQRAAGSKYQADRSAEGVGVSREGGH